MEIGSLFARERSVDPGSSDENQRKFVLYLKRNDDAGNGVVISPATIVKKLDALGDQAASGFGRVSRDIGSISDHCSALDAKVESLEKLLLERTSSRSVTRSNSLAVTNKPLS